MLKKFNVILVVFISTFAHSQQKFYAGFSAGIANQRSVSHKEFTASNAYNFQLNTGYQLSSLFSLELGVGFSKSNYYHQIDINECTDLKPEYHYKPFPVNYISMPVQLKFSPFKRAFKPFVRAGFAPELRHAAYLDLIYNVNSIIDLGIEYKPFDKFSFLFYCRNDNSLMSSYTPGVYLKLFKETDLISNLGFNYYF